MPRLVREMYRPLDITPLVLSGAVVDDFIKLIDSNINALRLQQPRFRLHIDSATQRWNAGVQMDVPVECGEAAPQSSSHGYLGRTHTLIIVDCMHSGCESTERHMDQATIQAMTKGYEELFRTCFHDIGL